MRKAKKERCNICGREFKRITNHIRAHANKGDEYRGDKLNKEDYMFHYRSIAYKYNELIEATLKDYGDMVKLRFLIDKELPTAEKNRYIETEQTGYDHEQSKFTTEIFTKIKDNYKTRNELNDQGEAWKVNWGVNERLLEQHVKIKRRIGLYPIKAMSKKLCFDIDSDNKYLTAMFVQALCGFGIKHKDILVTLSNNKGYHVDIYFDEFIDNKTIRQFDELVRSEVDCWMLAGLVKSKVDSRGYGNSPLFLPFSENFSIGGYRGVVDRNLDPVDRYEEISKVLNIDFVKKELIISVLEKNKDFFKVDEDKQSEILNSNKETRLNLNETLKDMNLDSIGGIKSHIERFNRLETIEPGTRNNLVFFYGIALVHTGVTNEESLYSILINFQKRLKGYTSSQAEIERETRGTVKSLLKPGKDSAYRYLLDLKTIGFITKNQILQMTKIKTDSLRRLYLSLVVGSNKFKGPDGTFEFAYSQINGIIGFNIHRGTLLERLRTLQELGYIKIVRHGYREKGCLEYETNIYKIIENEEDFARKKCYVFNDISLITYETLLRASEELLSRWDIEKLQGKKTGLKKQLKGFRTNKEAEGILRERIIA